MGTICIKRRVREEQVSSVAAAEKKKRRRRRRSSRNYRKEMAEGTGLEPA